MFYFFDSYWITLLVYLLGVGLVLSLRFELHYILQILNYKHEIKKEITLEKEESEQTDSIDENSEVA